MKYYDILVIWSTTRRPRSKWYRSILAASLTEASNIALRKHNVSGAAVSMGWAQWPQPQRKI